MENFLFKQIERIIVDLTEEILVTFFLTATDAWDVLFEQVLKDND